MLVPGVDGIHHKRTHLREAGLPEHRLGKVSIETDDFRRGHIDDIDPKIDLAFSQRYFVCLLWGFLDDSTELVRIHQHAVEG